MEMSQKSKLMQWIDYRVRITTQDGKMFVGTFLAFDKHLNVVLVDTEEFRRVKNKKKTGDGMNIEVGDREEKRILGMIILRGQNIVSFTAEKPPTLHVKTTICSSPSNKFHVRIKNKIKLLQDLGKQPQ